MKNQLLLITTLALGTLSAQPAPKDPFARNAPAAPAEPMVPMLLSVCYETFSMPLAVAAEFQRGNPTDSEIYGLVTTALGKEKARQESFTILRTKPAQKATTESISEQIYPTEYASSSMPDSLGVAISPTRKKEAPEPVKDPAKPQVTPDKVVPEPKEIRKVDASKLENAPDASDLSNIATPTMPTAFETRNTGFTLEIEPQLAEDLKLVDLRIVPEHVALVGHSIHGQGLSKAEMPIFESQRINTAISVKINQPALLGTINRPPGSKLDPDSANRVWFAFVTVTLAKP